MQNARIDGMHRIKDKKAKWRGRREKKIDMGQKRTAAEDTVYSGT